MTTASANMPAVFLAPGVSREVVVGKVGNLVLRRPISRVWLLSLMAGDWTLRRARNVDRLAVL